MYNPREAQLDFIITRSAIAVLILLVLVFISSIAYRDGIKYGLINISPVISTGVITTVDNGSHQQSDKHVIYDFIEEYSGRKITGSFLPDQTFDKNDYVVGSNIKIISSKYFPEQNYIENLLHRLEPGFYILITCVLIILLIFGFLTWNLLKYFQFKDESKRY